MPEEPINNTGTPPASGSEPASPSPRPKRRQPQPKLNKAALRELDKAEQISVSARKTEFAGPLGEQGITPDQVDTLVAKILSASQTGSRALQSTIEKEGDTLEEQTCKKKLVGLFRQVQAAARQRFARREPVRLQEFFIGQRIDQSRRALKQFSQGLLDKLAEERPPGVDTDLIIKIQQERQAYVGSDDDQAEDAAEATAARAALEALIKEIRDLRMEIQFAADAAWPPGAPENVKARKAFQLPLNKPYTG
jgi:hypothetical protein